MKQRGCNAYSPDAGSSPFDNRYAAALMRAVPAIAPFAPVLFSMAERTPPMFYIICSLVSRTMLFILGQLQEYLLERGVRMRRLELVERAYEELLPMCDDSHAVAKRLGRL